MNDAITAHAIAVTVDARIKVLREQRQRDRLGAYSALWPPTRVARETELRALLLLVRSARRMARRAETEAKAQAARARTDYHGWQASGPMA